jgi:hypothetical protein
VFRGIHTTASCSFSSCRCKSAAVNGRGCLNGPGPVPTPVLSPGRYPAGPLAMDVGKIGEAKGGDIWLIVLWFEGRIFREGETGVRRGGCICWDVRREAVLEAPKGRGEGGTEFRSGAMIADK